MTETGGDYTPEERHAGREYLALNKSVVASIGSMYETYLALAESYNNGRVFRQLGGPIERLQYSISPFEGLIGARVQATCEILELLGQESLLLAIWNARHAKKATGAKRFDRLERYVTPIDPRVLPVKIKYMEFKFGNVIKSAPNVTPTAGPISDSGVSTHDAIFDTKARVYQSAIHDLKLLTRIKPVAIV